MIDPQHYVRPAPWHYEINVHTTQREDNMLEIRLELAGDVQLQDIIEFAELAKRYGDKTQRDILHPTEGNRHRQMLAFKPQHSKLNTEPAPAKRNGPRIVDYVDLEHRARKLKDLSKVHKNGNTHHTYHHR